MTEQLVTAYTRYKAQRERIKERQRQELEEALLPYAHDLGEAIADAKSRGLKVDDIATLIGNKNRNFQYEMLHAYSQTTKDTMEPMSPQEEPVQDVTWKVEPVDGGGPDAWYVEVNTNNTMDCWIVKTYKGSVEDLPDEWLTAPPESRKLYQDIVAEIERQANG